MTTEGSGMSETLLQMTKGIGVSHPPLHGTECSIELRPPLQTTEGSEVSHPPLQLTEGSGVFCSLLQTTSGVSHPPLLTIECNIVSHPPLQRMMVVMFHPLFVTNDSRQHLSHPLLQMTEGHILHFRVQTNIHAAPSMTSLLSRCVPLVGGYNWTKRAHKLHKS